MQVELVPESDVILPGATLTLGIRFRIESGWHIYWPGRNDSGFPPSIDLSLPPGFTSGTPMWPAPARHVMPGGILDHVYTDELVVLVPITAPATARAGDSAKLGLSSGWLVCADVCTPEKGDASLELKIADRAAKPGKAAGSEVITRARKALPQQLPKDPKVVGVTALAGWLVVHAPGATTIEFYPSDDCAPTPDLLDQGVAKGEQLRVRMTPEPGAARARGVLRVTHDKAVQVFAIDLPIEPEPVK